jgi:predicted nucleic acid-binding Zn ribbon protein
MKKLILLFIIFLIPSVLAISTDLKPSYQQGETIIIKISGDILQEIPSENIELKRGHVQVPFNYEIDKVGLDYFLYGIAPNSQNNYTLIINDIIVKENGLPTIKNFKQNFSTTSNLVSYSIKPGFIITSSNFVITATSNLNTTTTITTNFPSTRNIVLYPGKNEIIFSIKDVDAGFTALNLGFYSIPVLIFKEIAPPESQGESDSEEQQDNELKEQDEKQDEGGGGYDGGSGNGGDGGGGGSFWDFFGGSDEQDQGEDEYKVDSDSEEQNEKGDVSDKSETREPQELLPDFRFKPTRVDSITLIDKTPEYPFTLINAGLKPISNISFEYNSTLFEIYPASLESLPPRSSKNFLIFVILKNLTINEKIIAHSNEQTVELFANISFTENPAEVQTPYLEEEFKEVQGYYCSQLKGKFCIGTEVCSQKTIESLDGKNCCTATCQAPKKKSTSTNKIIGYGIAALILIIIVLVAARYMKSKKIRRDPLKKVKSSSSNLPSRRPSRF